ncbi:MAG: YecA family protein [Rubrivivax sp.]|jgi:uncharacterized protein
MSNAAPALSPLADTDIERLQGLLDELPASLAAPDVTLLDGYLCGVLLQPQRIPEIDWLPGVFDLDGPADPRPGLPQPLVTEIARLARRRHAELDHAIGARDWFDPWVFGASDEVGDDDEAPAEAGSADDVDDGDDPLLPWVAGFAAAMDRFPALMALDNPALVEPLALLYLHFDAADLEDADALLAVIETLEPPADLGEAVQDAVRAVMLIADVSRPRPVAAVPRSGRTPAGRKGGKPSGGRRR